jgi:hypothetical protein
MMPRVPTGLQPFPTQAVNLLNDVLTRARTHLNDDDGSNWPDPRLIPKAQQAFEELEADLILAGIPIINSQNTIFTVPAYDINAHGGVPFDLSTLPAYPKDMIMPIQMKERDVWEQWRDFVDMIETDFAPITSTDLRLRYWTWYQGKIVVMGCLRDRQVLLRYQRFLPVPGLNSDSIIVPLGQLHLSYRTAALAALSQPTMRQLGMDLDQRAQINLDKIVRMNIKQQQNLPTKRRPYHRGYGRNRVLRDF